MKTKTRVVKTDRIRMAELPRGIVINGVAPGMLVTLTRSAWEDLAEVYGIGEPFLKRLFASKDHWPLAGQIVNHFFCCEPRRLRFHIRGDVVESIEACG